MKILFSQKKSQSIDLVSTLECAGIYQCYLKSMSFKDLKNTLRKPHHHTGYEVHMIISGHYVYRVEGTPIRVDAGELVIFSPFVTHYSESESEDTKKCTLTFSVSKDSPCFASCTTPPYKRTKIPHAVLDAIKAIQSEDKLSGYLSDTIIENRIFEAIVHLMRNFVSQEFVTSEKVDNYTDARVVLAKQYVKDNIIRPLSVEEVAAYCCISPKQLARLFLTYEHTAVSEYIRYRRYVHIECMLSSTTLSLKEISEAMNFNNEYYFNTFFKKHSGMTPGAYRKSVQKTD